jgi:hypothetical protein
MSEVQEKRRKRSLDGKHPLPELQHHLQGVEGRALGLRSLNALHDGRVANLPAEVNELQETEAELEMEHDKDTLSPQPGMHLAGHRVAAGANSRLHDVPERKRMHRGGALEPDDDIKSGKGTALAA